jgi:PAS domain S-box-containing protein
MNLNKEMDIKKRVAEVAKELYPFDLPIGVYLVTKEGDFVRLNRRAQEILEFQQNDDEVNVNINDFYCDPGERIHLMKELEEAEASGRFLEKKVIRFNIDGKRIWVQDYCRSLKDPETGEIIGYTGCLEDVTEEESLRQLFEKLPVGVYKLDAQNKIVRVNKAMADILGYEHPSELEGINIKDIYVDPREADEFDRLIRDQGFVMDERVELFKKTKERRYVSVYAYKKTDTDGETYIGCEGTLQDVTEEENYRHIRDEIPVGTYMVRKNGNGEEIIWQCNRAFANMFEYEIDDLKGKDIKELYATKKGYEDFIKEITEKHIRNEIRGGIPIKAKTAKGRLMNFEVHCRILTDEAGNIVGRAGIVLDISNEVALHELRDDIGKILHFYSAALVTLDQSIKPLLGALAPDPFEVGEVLTIARAIEALIEPAKNLKNALGKLMQIRNISPERQSALPEMDWGTLENQMHLLEKYREKIPYPEFQVATLHETSRIILEIYNKIEKEKLPSKLTGDLFNKAKNLERICCLIRTHQTLDTIIEVDYSIRALREFVIFQQRQPDPATVCNISTMIQNAIYQLYLFAIHRKVVIEQDYQSCQAKVKVDERSVLRALSNLLYNAIKYSWHREIGKKPWTTVKAFIIQDKVHVEFQNYGVPISKEEIENELIFKFGYRGKYSGDQRRMGTGIGLTDARDTARKHGGDLIIKSSPASGGSESDYSQPFLTTATFILPIHES